MNITEAKQFVRELITSFPCFEEAARSSPDLAATHRAWARAWVDLELKECQDVLAELEKGATISFDDRQAPGPFIRRLALANRRNRPKSEEELVREQEERGGRLNRKRNYQGSPIGEAWSKIMKLKSQGASEEVIYRTIEEVLSE